jgi:hypothetical protein
MGEKAFVGEVIVEDDIGPADAIAPLDGYQSGIAGTCADEVDEAFV